MTANVWRGWGGVPTAASLFIGEPGRAAQFGALWQNISHMMGAQLSQVHHCAFGASEPTTATYRMQYFAHPNARNLVVSIVPFGIPSGPTEGTIAVTGADAPATRRLNHSLTGNTAGDIPPPHDFIFIVPVTVDSLQEIVWNTVDIRPHSITVYEARRTMLREADSDLMVDRSFADPRLHIVDTGEAGSPPRGQRALLDLIGQTRDNMRRHPIGFFFGTGVTDSTAGPSFGTIFSNIRCRSRDLQEGTTETRTRFFVYVSAIGAGTWTIRIRDQASSDVTDITGITTTGWKGSTSPPTLLSHGAAFNMEHSAVDEVEIEASRTAGAGSITINGVTVIEDPV